MTWKRILRVLQLPCYGCVNPWWLTPKVPKRFWFLTNSVVFLVAQDGLTVSLSLSVNLYLLSTFYTATSCNDVIFIIKGVLNFLKYTLEVLTHHRQNSIKTCGLQRGSFDQRDWQVTSTTLASTSIPSWTNAERLQVHNGMDVHDVDFRMDWVFMNFLPSQILSFHIHLNRHKVDGIMAWHSTIKVISLYVSFFHFRNFLFYDFTIFLWRGTYWMFQMALRISWAFFWGSDSSEVLKITLIQSPKDICREEYPTTSLESESKHQPFESGYWTHAKGSIYSCYLEVESQDCIIWSSWLHVLSIF